MSRTVLSVDAPLSDFIEEQVANGHYKTPEEVVGAGLRLLAEYERKVEALRAALIEGEESGPAEPFDFDEFIAEMHAGS